MAVFPVSEGEAERVEAGHAQANIGHHQLFAQLVVTQYAIGKPGEARMRRRFGQRGCQVRATRDALQLRWGSVKPADQRLVVILTVQHNHPPQQAVERCRRAEQLLRLYALARQFGFYALFGHVFAAQG